MTSALIQFRADETEKTQAIQICEELGLSLNAYLRMCVSRLIKEKGVPFSMNLTSKEDNLCSENPGLAAMKKASLIATERGISNMSLDEINAEITASRS